MKQNRLFLVGFLLLGLVFMGTQQAEAVAIRSGFDGSTLVRNDDQSTGLVGLGFTANFFGVSHTDLTVNNNGNVTFDGVLSSFTPFNIVTTGRQIIAPFSRMLIPARVDYL